MHTPGPWEFDGDYVWAESIKGYVADPQTEDMLSGKEVPLNKAREQWQANARLIAAAPELLAFVAELAAGKNATTRDLPPSIVRDAKALIAKARG